MTKLQEAKGRFFLTIPKPIIERSGLKKGDTLFVEYDRRTNIIEIEKKD